MTLLELRLPNQRNVLSAAVYSGILFLWVGRRRRALSFVLSGPACSFTGAGRWSW